MLPLVWPVLSAEISGLVRLRRAGESGAQCTVVQCCVHGPPMSATTYERQLKPDRTQRRRTVWTASDRRDGHTLGWILVSA